MTEFVIAATYVLVPLFILIPLLGKYIDIKHATIMAARYEAWEYTVWYTLDSEDTGDTNSTLLPDDNDILDNFAAFDMSLNYKTLANTRAEAHNRTLSSVGAELGDGTSADDTAKTVRISPISSTSDTSVDTVAGCSESSNLLWTDHAGLPLYCGEVVRNDYGVGDPTPTLTLFGMDVGDWINQILGVFAAAFGFIADIVGFVSTGDGPSAGFTAINLDGYSFVDLQTLVATHSYGADLRTDLSGNHVGSEQTTAFKAKAGVLADGWNAGGTDHTYLQVGGTTPATVVNTLLNLPGLGEVWDAAAFFAPELSRCDPGGTSEPPDPLIKSPLAAPEGHLWLGYVDGDVVHPDRLSDPDDADDNPLGDHECDDAGRCYWDEIQIAEDLGRDPSVEGEGLSHSPCIP